MRSVSSVGKSQSFRGRLLVHRVVVGVEDALGGGVGEGLAIGDGAALEGDAVLGVLGVGDFALDVGDYDGGGLGGVGEDEGEVRTLEDEGEVTGLGGREQGRGALVFEGGVVVVVGRFAAASGGGAFEGEGALRLGVEVERVEGVELVAEVEGERRGAVGEVEGEGAAAPDYGDGEERAACALGEALEEVGLVEVDDLGAELGGGDGVLFEGVGRGSRAVVGAEEDEGVGHGLFAREGDEGEVELERVRHEADGGGGEEVRQEVVAAGGADVVLEVDEVEGVGAFLLVVDAAGGGGEVVLLHVVLNEGAEVVELGGGVVGVEGGGEDYVAA